jgi:hypothetical protein
VWSFSFRSIKNKGLLTSFNVRCRLRYRADSFLRCGESEKRTLGSGSFESKVRFQPWMGPKSESGFRPTEKYNLGGFPETDFRCGLLATGRPTKDIMGMNPVRRPGTLSMYKDCDPPSPPTFVIHESKTNSVSGLPLGNVFLTLISFQICIENRENVILLTMPR